MDRGYIRETKNGPSVAEQREALRSAGVEVDGQYPPVYIDAVPKSRRHRAASDETLPERALIIKGVRPGSRLVVASLDRLGVSSGDILQVLCTMIDKGCPVYDVAAAVTYDADTPRKALIDAAVAAEVVLRQERMRRARKVRADRIGAGQKAAQGGNAGWQPDAKTLAAVKTDWLENMGLSQAQIEKKHGVSRSTLRRRFGERGARRGRQAKQPT